MTKRSVSGERLTGSLILYVVKGSALQAAMALPSQVLLQLYFEYLAVNIAEKKTVKALKH
jgi:hypothetical protein